MEWFEKLLMKVQYKICIPMYRDIILNDNYKYSTKYIFFEIFRISK